MSYKGTAVVTGLPELESMRRLRESKESPVETPNAQHKPVAKIQMIHGKQHFNLGGKMYVLDKGQVLEDLDQPTSEAAEGGPGSGPHQGSGIAKSIAQKHGYKVTGRGKGGNINMKHENGESLSISSNGQTWTHRSPERGVTSGQGARDLHAHLLHGNAEDEG